MNAEPPLQRKKRVDGFPVSKPSMEPPLLRKKRSDSASPIRQVMEPELQRRKKPLPYKKTAPIATELHLAGNQHDDYMLLGDQSKFNENVKYRIRSRSAHGNGTAPEHRPQRPDRVVSQPDPSSNVPDRAHSHNQPRNPAPAQDAHRGERQSRSKERGPPPKVVVDTGKPTRVTGKGDSGLKLDLAKERSPSRKVTGEQGGHDRVIVDHNHKGILRKSAATQSTPRLAREVESDVSSGLPLQKRETQGDGGVAWKYSKDASRKTEKGLRAEERHLEKDEAIRAADKAPKPANQERAAGPNHAIKYRLGIAPHRSTGPIRFSEYQREFQWKDPIKSSPLISAETVVYKSHPDLTLFRSSNMAEDSEYKAQYKAWASPQPAEDSHNTKNDIAQQNRHAADQPKKAKIRRSKSMKEFPARHKPSVGGVSASAADGSAAAKQPETNGASTDQRPETTDASIEQEGQPKKKYRSEYARNFIAPWNYLYDEGAWKRVHAKEDMESELQRRPATALSASSAGWYAEVLELRRFADEYRKRAQGTHFSREHLAQLFAKNAELWDTVSSSSSIPSSLQSADDPKRSQPGTSAPKRSAGKTQKQFGSKPTPLLAADDEISARSGSITPSGSTYSEAEKENAFPVAKTRQQWKRPHMAQTAPGALRGGVWTKDFKASHNENRDSSHDYHSDSYEVSSQGSESSGYGHGSKATKVKGKVNQVKSSKEKTRNQLSTNQQKSSASWLSHTTIKSHGLPTRDTHVLVDVNGQDGYQGHRKAATGPAAMEFEDKAIQIQEEDLMSVASSRSLASSCSLASEVLERARNRRDEFWN